MSTYIANFEVIIETKLLNVSDKEADKIITEFINKIKSNKNYYNFNEINEILHIKDSKIYITSVNMNDCQKMDSDLERKEFTINLRF